MMITERTRPIKIFEQKLHTVAFFIKIPQRSTTIYPFQIKN